MRKSICLNMIVKNESPIIRETLTNLCNYLTFDYWVIADTGSTDDTREVIAAFFKERNIGGELVQHEWVDFGHNRTLALNAAFGKTDYLLIFDADDKICGDFKLPDELTLDKYMLKFGPNFVYYRPLLINNRVKWRFQCVLHEYLSTCENEKKTTETRLNGDYHLISGRTGNRSKNPNKYRDDATVLKNAFEKEPDEGIKNRYAFYCAQSYKDASMKEEAIEWYKKCLTLNSWAQEKYVACLEVGNLSANKNDKIVYWLKTVEYDKERIEGVVKAMELLYNDGSHVLVNALYKQFHNYTKPDNKLFIDMTKYNMEMEYYNSISAYYVGDNDSGYECCKKILLENVLPREKIEATKKNVSFYKDLSEKDLSEKDLSEKDLSEKDLSEKDTDKELKLENDKEIKNKNNPLVLITFTTCKRLDLFRQTMNSILTNWTDINKIDYWFCVDDNSSREDRDQMREMYPWFDYYMKTVAERGHRASMNIIWNKLAHLKPTYWIHMEDDFLFHYKGEYVLTGLFDETVKQICYNRNYAETSIDERVKGHLPYKHGLVIHDHKHGTFNYQNCHYWPNYSFRPSIVDAATILSLGNYDSPNTFFEMDYAVKWTAAGYKTAFVDRITCTHIGKLTKDTTTANAYELNGVAQFNGTIEKKETAPVIKVVNLKRRPDRKAATIERLDGLNYEFVEAVDGSQLTPTKELFKLFKGNDFGNRKGFIGCALSHYNLWKQLLDDAKNEYYVIFEDDFSLTLDFKESFRSLISEFPTRDVLFMGCTHTRTSSDAMRMQPLNRTNYIGGTFAYSINKRGAQKMIDYINNNGIKHGIDYVMKITPDMEMYECCPSIVLSEYALSTTTDSDIQHDYSGIDFTPMFSSNYTFVSGLDHCGDDLYCKRLPLCEQFLIADEDPDCKGFNTLGFFKRNVNNLTTSPYFGQTDGIYIKKQRVTLVMSPDLNTYFIVNRDRYSMNNETKFIDYFFPFQTDVTLHVYGIQTPDAECMNPDNLNAMVCVENCRGHAHYKHYNKYNDFGNDRIQIYLYNHIDKCILTDKYIAIPVIYTQMTYFRNNYSSIAPTIRTESKKFCLFATSLNGYRNQEKQTIMDMLKTIGPCDTIESFRDVIGDKSCYHSVELLNLFNQYKFVFVCENSVCDGYITEKIFNCLFARTIPIYSGSNKIHDYINENAFINVNMNACKELITRIHTDDEFYKHMINEPKMSRAYDDEQYDVLLKSFIEKRKKHVVTLCADSLCAIKPRRIYVGKNVNAWNRNVVECILDEFPNHILTDNENESHVGIYHILDKRARVNDKQFLIVVSGESYEYVVKPNLFIGSVASSNAHKHIHFPQLFLSLNERRANCEFEHVEKTKFCAFMYSMDYEHRNEMFHQLSLYKRVDALGKACNNVQVENTRYTYNETETYNDIAVKLYSKYKFVLAVENIMKPGYFTEKLINPILAKSIPIYWGHESAFEYINKKRVVYAFDYGSPQELNDAVKFIDENPEEYCRIVNEPTYVKDYTSFVASFNRELRDALS
jgi:GR25 family glycosyltransferase involved in LPS biosynthesis